jgi:hypothetical protein
VLPDILDIISKKGQEDNNPKKKTKPNYNMALFLTDSLLKKILKKILEHSYASFPSWPQYAFLLFLYEDVFSADF